MTNRRCCDRETEEKKGAKKKDTVPSIFDPVEDRLLGFGDCVEKERHALCRGARRDRVAKNALHERRCRLSRGGRWLDAPVAPVRDGDGDAVFGGHGTAAVANGVALTSSVLQSHKHRVVDKTVSCMQKGMQRNVDRKCLRFLNRE